MTTEAMQIHFFSLFYIYAIISIRQMLRVTAFNFYFEQVQNKCMSCQKQCYCNEKQNAHEAT